MIQYVPFHQRAWHAGVSSWDGREKCNDFTIGIELEGCDEQRFEQKQYLQLANVMMVLCETYHKLNYQQIKGHQEIALNRKTDPRPFFDWEYLRRLLFQA